MIATREQAHVFLKPQVCMEFVELDKDVVGASEVVGAVVVDEHGSGVGKGDSEAADEVSIVLSFAVAGALEKDQSKRARVMSCRSIVMASGMREWEIQKVMLGGFFVAVVFEWERDVRKGK